MVRHKVYKNIKLKNQTKQPFLLEVRYKEQRSEYLSFGFTYVRNQSDPVPQCIITRTIMRGINMYQNAQWQKPIFQELISRVLFEMETRGQVFCIALGPVTICVTIRTIGLLYLFYNAG